MPLLSLDPVPILETQDSGLLLFRDNVQLNYNKIQDIVNRLDSVNIKSGFSIESIVTSSTRPLQPFVGQEIFETDTGLLKIWSGSTWVTETNMKAFGAAADLIVGASPPAIDTGSVQFKIQAASVVRTFSGGVTTNVTFPTAFPNGLGSVVVCGGDGNNTNDRIFTPRVYSLSKFDLVCMDRLGNFVNTTERFNYIAIGW